MRIQVLGIRENPAIQEPNDVGDDDEELANTIQPQIDIVQNKLSEPWDFDGFDLNIIRMDSSRFWTNSKSNSLHVVNCHQDLVSLSHLITITKSTVVISLPSTNLSFTYRAPNRYQKEFGEEPFKNVLDEALEVLFTLFPWQTVISRIVCASGCTTINELALESAFFLESSGSIVLTKTEGPSARPTTVQSGNIIITTLPICESREALEKFALIAITKEEGGETPDWFDDVPPMFDDEELDGILAEQTAIIERANERISEAAAKKAQNKEWKSVLYENGGKLEDIVKSMLGSIFEWNPNSFEDIGTSDFIIEYNGETFVGEIKGENSNVTNSKLSQLTMNADIDVEKGRIPEGLPTHRLLIANTFRKQRLEDRTPVNEQQIEYARERLGCLIVTTAVLLQLFEAFTIGSISRDCAIELLSGTGILEDSDIRAAKAANTC